jgi:hypothetical protein
MTQKITEQKMRELLKLIATEETKEREARKGLAFIMEGNGWLDLTAGMYEAIKLLLSVEVYDWLAYYLWECNRNGKVTLADGREFIFSTDDQFIDFLKETGCLEIV